MSSQGACVEQAENELGGSLSLFQGGDGSAHPCDMQRGVRLQTDPAERGQPCRPGGPAAGQEENPSFSAAASRLLGSGGKRTCMPALETRTDSPGETQKYPKIQVSTGQEFSAK